MKHFVHLTMFVMVLALIIPGCEKESSNPVVPLSEPTDVSTLAKSNNGCVTIQDGQLYTTDGELISTGYSQWGYNYQAHMFNGMYCDYHPNYRPGGAGHEQCMAEYGDAELIMKWNDAWLANKDCDGDGLLDRHYGFDSYIGSGAWLTNHMRDSYVGDDGKTHYWESFVKIVAKPTADYNCAATGGVEIWGAFCEIQRVYNDPYAGYHGLEFKAVQPGLGNW